MSDTGRFVALGLARARAQWFRSVAQWAHSGSIALDFLKCVSGEEVRARLGSGRPVSALIVEAGLPLVDRDLLAAASRVGCPVFVVDDGRVNRNWVALGASCVLDAGFGRQDLLDALVHHATPIPRGTVFTGPEAAEAAPVSWRGRVAAVTGAGGTGVSTAAIALAQALADDARLGSMVVLADLRLHGEQAMLHDAPDVVPGIQDLVDAHRHGRVSVEEVRATTFRVEERGYHLLLGLRQSRHWTALRPRSFGAAFDSLRRSFGVVVCDIDADLEGEAQGGSIDVEERHTMARTGARQADVVFVVGLATMKGLHGMVRVVHELSGAGIEPEVVVPVVNRAPRSGRARAGLTTTLAELLAPVGGRSNGAAVSSGRPRPPLFLPERPVDGALRDCIRLPRGLGAPLAEVFGSLTAEAHLSRTALAVAGPAPVGPGSLGTRAGA